MSGWTTGTTILKTVKSKKKNSSPERGVVGYDSSNLIEDYKTIW